MTGLILHRTILRIFEAKRNSTNFFCGFYKNQKSMIMAENAHGTCTAGPAPRRQYYPFEYSSRLKSINKDMASTAPALIAHQHSINKE